MEEVDKNIVQDHFFCVNFDLKYMFGGNMDSIKLVIRAVRYILIVTSIKLHSLTFDNNFIKIVYKRFLYEIKN